MKSVLKSLTIQRGFRLGATDGQIGQCEDFLIDESTWAIRYMVADTRKWLPGRKVLIWPISLEKTSENERSLDEICN